jgi:Ran GTPase-activating protein (RanGAP) involved in mRNA processing and transport
LNENKNL